jgi:hypothetical protein
MRLRGPTSVSRPAQDRPRKSWHSKFALLAAALLATILSGCAVPLGPGFRLRSRQVVLGNAPGPSAPVHIRVSEQIENTGNRALSYLDVSLPAATDPAKSHLAIRVDGKPVTPKAISQDPTAPIRVGFDPPWPMRQRREIVVEYDLATDPISGGVASATAEGFYLADPDALPLWVTPVGFFVRGEVLTREERFEVTLPADFRVLASGRQERRRAADGNVFYRFRTSGKELPSFVIAGRYQEQITTTPGGSLVFWTFRSLDPAMAQMAAERLTATTAVFARLFGPPPAPGPLRIVETPPGVLSLDAEAPGRPAEAAAFPQGLLVGPRAFEQGIASEHVMRVAEAELVRIWFGWRVPLRPEVDTLLGRGLGLFAVALAAEARGGQPARRIEIARLLEEYDRAHAAGDEGSLLRPARQSTPQQIAASALKAALFLADLDDLAGGDKFEQSIQRLQLGLAGRGLAVSLDDLRSSLEISAGTPMADVFRQWLNHPGVPDGFRERYASASPSAAAPRKEIARIELFRRQR